MYCSFTFQYLNFIVHVQKYGFNTRVTGPSLEWMFLQLRTTYVHVHIKLNVEKSYDFILQVCQIMDTVRECRCCSEITQLTSLVDLHNDQAEDPIRCITDHHHHRLAVATQAAVTLLHPSLSWARLTVSSTLGWGPH